MLLTVNSDSSSRKVVEAELLDRYAKGYEVRCTDSAGEALALLERLATEDEAVALVLAAQALSDMPGTELHARIRTLHPLAKRALLLPWGAWGDRVMAETILDAMALGATDSYVLEPAPPRDEQFHQAISTLLFEWSRDQRIAPHTIHIVGETWSGRAYELRQVLQRCALPHSFCLADSEQGREIVRKAGPRAEIPLIALPNGEIISNPTDRELAESDGTALGKGENEFDVVVVGAGPAGLSSAVYGTSEGLSTLVIDSGGVGGQATSSSMIRNYLGFPRGISGGLLAQRAYEQAWIFRANFTFMTIATGLRRTNDERLRIELSDNRAVTARTVILATGAAYRRLNVPELERLRGAGVYYGGPLSESNAMAGKEVVVAGGANSAGQAALFLARYARKVTLAARADSLAASMSHYLTRELAATPTVEIRLNTEIVGGGGQDRLERLVLRDRVGGGEETLPADGLFILIGAEPHTAWLPEEIARDDHGFLLTGPDIPGEVSFTAGPPPMSLETSMPGVFAAGDVRRGSIRRVASAVGEGSIAIQQVHQWLASSRATVHAGG